MNVIIDNFVSDNLNLINSTKNLLIMFPPLRERVIEICEKDINSTNTERQQKVIAVLIKYNWLFNDNKVIILLKKMPPKTLYNAELFIALSLETQKKYCDQLAIDSNELKILFPFSRGVGNNSIVIRYCQNAFPEEHDPIIEDSYRKQITIEGKVYLLEILVTAGQGEHEALRTSAIEKACNIVMVYNVCDRSSFDERKLDLQSIHNNNIWGQFIAKILVGNKIDLKDERQISFGEAFFTTLQFGLPYIECSAKDNVNVNEIIETLVKLTNHDYSLARLLKKFNSEITTHKNKSFDKKGTSQFSYKSSPSLGLFITSAGTKVKEEKAGNTHSGHNKDKHDENNNGKHQVNEKCRLM